MREMGDMDYVTATTHLLKRWDLLPLNFDFGVATRGAGGAPTRPKICKFDILLRYWGELSVDYSCYDTVHQ